MMRRPALLLTVLLFGCATFGQLKLGLNALMGHKPEVAFRVLGYPSGTQRFGSDTVYVWSTSRSGIAFIPQTSTTIGTVGTTPVFGTTNYNQAVSVGYNCTIKLVAGSNGRLKHWEFDGNKGGCESYIKRAYEYYKSQEKPSKSETRPNSWAEEWHKSFDKSEEKPSEPETRPDSWAEEWHKSFGHPPK